MSTKMTSYHIIVVFSLIIPSFALFYRQFQTVSDCETAPSENWHEFFDISQLKCTKCTQGTDLQTVSSDGLRCVCQPGTKIVRDFGGTDLHCEACPENQATSENGWECVACGSNNPFNEATKECTPCPESEITVERTLDGIADGEQKCQPCVELTSPSEGNTRCTRCNQVLSVIPGATTCDCPTEQRTGGLCFGSPTDIIDEDPELYQVNLGSVVVDSQFFYDNVRATYAMCKHPYYNLTACQTLANMCVATLYTRTNEDTVKDACSGYLEISKGNQANPQEWPANMSWLYYLEDLAEDVLSDTRITTEYTFPDSTLNFKVARYTMNGTFLGLTDVKGGDLQFCEASESILDAAFVFGTTYERECTISATDLWDEEKYETIFYDMYLEFESQGSTQLFAVPLLIGDYGNTDRAGWQLYRRFFLVDNISGKPISSPATNRQNRNDGGEAVTNQAQAVRYAKDITIHIALQEDTGDGRIYPPYIQIDYGVATLEDYSSAKSLPVTFRVTYTMDLGQYDEDVSIAVGVLSAFAFAYAFVQSWCWSKRTGRIAIDFITLIKFVLFIIGNLANVFFVVMFGAALWWLIFYKRQKNVYLIVPTSSQESDFVAFLASAFVLKLVQLVHIIAIQARIDIFFIDWERPRGKVSSSGDAAGQKGSEAPVSIWRTYFVANEWNEIQTTRKTNSFFQIFCTLFFLNVVGFENVTSSDPNSDLSRDSDKYYAPDSRIFRFAVAALVYILVAVVQWIFYTFIYERFIEDRVRNYVDLCSMSNVSVFILENSQFGYYIHGRSVHGRADTDMKEMHENLRREEDDLCGKRGLMPNTDQQTFQMAVPLQLRNQYDKVMAPINNPQQAAPMLRGERGPGDTNIDQLTVQKISAYAVLNRFLQAFIDHSLREVDYIIKDRLLLESILNMEFTDTTDKGFLYNDDGHSFDQVLFYGHESMLIIFEVLLFGVIDLMAENYVLSAVILYLGMEIIYMVRNSLARNNLASKTLVDQRFLI